MQVQLMPIFLTLALATSCLVGEPSLSGVSSPQVYLNNQLCSSSGGTANCTANLAATQSTKDNTCPTSSNQHLWPIDGAASDCHGWAATDSTGRQHYNSADQIKCSCDGTSMTYSQYPGVLDCSGTANPKSFQLNQCVQGTPPSLWDTATDLSCCVPMDDCVSALQDQADWLQNGVRYQPEVPDADRDLFITIGMTDKSDCTEINNRTILKLYVGPNTTQTCQGWNHYLNPYPDTSVVHQNSAVGVKCVDGGVSYTQYTDVDCGGDHPTDKTDWYQQCHQGMPPTVYTEVLDFSGCLKQGYKPTPGQ
eukprot:TRINITY_DN5872_c0_g1_i5.p1 TRINITY_DN5872_c0_g1~~TRINITY_DN5872_c0_g1_i5.p1  ORF type:complete len:307 (+),score=68.11 TRINITY_DN5872_c0_g1_i5:306-1226(+)